jgi:hypothetical protein
VLLFVWWSADEQDPCDNQGGAGEHPRGRMFTQNEPSQEHGDDRVHKGVGGNERWAYMFD